ncbi:hypothetical protein V6N11_038118 [Hibiscus sabdariffa]|uniref:Uncharacterized protein n=1 Tax=Hibiscus sabdariffa TaxID=183260 RepID=A0ABR1ZR40_9ROSI
MIPIPSYHMAKGNYHASAAYVTSKSRAKVCLGLELVLILLMETPQASIGGNPPSKIGKLILAAQFFFRITVTGTTLAASHLIFKAKQNVDVMGMPFEAEYNYSPAFK